MSDDVLTDALGQRLAALLPPRPRRFRSPRRRAVDDRTALAGLVWVLHHDVPWRRLPASFGVSRVTCWRRLADWQAAGVWQALPATLLAALPAAGRLDVPTALVDSSPVHALTGGPRRVRARLTAAISARHII